MLFLFSSNFVFSCFWKHQTWVNIQFALNKNCMFEVFGVFAVYHLGFSSKQFQSCNKSLINQACSGPSWKNIGPWSFLYRPRCARSVLSRSRADILPARPTCLVNKIYVLTQGIRREFVPQGICTVGFLTKHIYIFWRQPITRFAY